MPRLVVIRILTILITECQNDNILAWSVGFMYFPLLVVLMDRRPILFLMGSFQVNTNNVESSIILLHGIIKHHQKACIYTIFNAYIIRFIVKTLLNTTHEKSFPPCCVYRKLALVYDFKNKYENQYINWTSLLLHKIYFIHNFLDERIF